MYIHFTRHAARFFVYETERELKHPHGEVSFQICVYIICKFEEEVEEEEENLNTSLSTRFYYDDYFDLITHGHTPAFHILLVHHITIVSCIRHYISTDNKYKMYNWHTVHMYSVFR